MDPRPIGVFDSGVGGLTALRELASLLPHESLIYFGDTGRVPYGSRSRETILKYARQDVSFLRTFDLKAIVVACGTVSTIALDALQGENPLPILGVVKPAVEEAARCTQTGRVGLIGTAATIRSGVFEARLRTAIPDARVTAAACPLFVPLVENGRFSPQDIVVSSVVAEYLAPLKAAGVDTLVLGCTHYPLLSDAIAAYMGKDVALVNTGAQCAHWVANLLRASNSLADAQHAGLRQYYVSDNADDFASLASVFLGEDITGSAQKIAIEDF